MTKRTKKKHDGIREEFRRSFKHGDYRAYRKRNLHNFDYIARSLRELRAQPYKMRCRNIEKAWILDLNIFKKKIGEVTFDEESEKEASVGKIV